MDVLRYARAEPNALPRLGTSWAHNPDTDAIGRGQTHVAPLPLLGIVAHSDQIGPHAKDSGELERTSVMFVGVLLVRCQYGFGQNGQPQKS